MICLTSGKILYYFELIPFMHCSLSWHIKEKISLSFMCCAKCACLGFKKLSNVVSTEILNQRSFSHLNKRSYWWMIFDQPSFIHFVIQSLIHFLAYPCFAFLKSFLRVCCQRQEVFPIRRTWVERRLLCFVCRTRMLWQLTKSLEGTFRVWRTHQPWQVISRFLARKPTSNLVDLSAGLKNLSHWNSFCWRSWSSSLI